jgi:hypothetical protein
LFDIGVHARRMRLRTATGPESVVSSTGAMVSISAVSAEYGKSGVAG